MKLAIVGSRNFDNYQLLHNTIFQWFWGATQTIISGGASGADSLAKRFTEENTQFNFTEYLADWEKYGKAAGPIRNELIVKECDMVLAFWDGKSKGTANTLSLAKKHKKSTFIVYF